MPDYRITLVNNLRYDENASALDVKYRYSNGQERLFRVEILLAERGKNVVAVHSNIDLINQPGVISKALIAHYPTPPTTEEYGISSVQPLLLEASLQAEASALAVGTPYSLNFTMDQNTVDILSKNNFVLFGFKAVKSASTGSPVVWFSTGVYGKSTNLSWSVQYEAYTTNSMIVPGGQISATNSYDIGLNESLIVTTPQGTGNVNTSVGVPNAVSIVSQTPTQLTCGISQTQPNSSTTSPMCAFPLFGNMTDVIAPIEKVLIMFSAGPVNTGTVIELSNSQGVLVDLTSENQVSGISFDINKGWNTGGQPNCSLVPSNSNIVPLVINPSRSLSQNVLARSARQLETATF